MKNFTKLKESNYYRFTRFLSLIMLVALMTTTFAMSIPTYVLDLRSTENFVVLAGSTVTGTTNTSIDGDVGLSPAAGSYVAGIDATNVTGMLYVVDASGPAGSVINSSLLQTAKSDLTIAYNDAAGRTPVPTGTFLNPNGGNIGTLNLVPGLYKFTSTCLITGSDVTLTGGPNDVWIFQIASDLVLGDYIKVILAGGARASNVFWQVGTSATLGTYSVFKGTILADQSVSLDVGATIEGRALAFSAAVTMNDGVAGTKPVSLTTESIFSVDPTELSFGNVNNGIIKRDSVVVTNTGTADLIISSVTSSKTLFTVTPTNGTIIPGANRKFYISFAPIANGLQNAYIYFNHNDADAKDSVQVSGTGISTQNEPVFSVNPMNLNFGNINNGIIKRDSVVVTNTGTADLIISSVTSSSPLFIVTPLNGTIIAGANRKFYITFAPVVSGLQNAYIYFNHNDADAKDSISVRGTGVSNVNSPEFSVNPIILTFGNIINGKSKTDTVTVTNTGNSDLIISSVTSSNQVFTVAPKNYIVKSGSTENFYITFSPVANGIQSGYIYFNHNDPDAKDSIGVSGTGVTSSSIENTTSPDIESISNYPNPFNSSTTIQYRMVNAGFVSLTIYNNLGQNIATLVNGFREAGVHAEQFTTTDNNSSLNSGIYYYRLNVGAFVMVKQMIFVK